MYAIHLLCSNLQDFLGHIHNLISYFHNFSGAIRYIELNDLRFHNLGFGGISLLNEIQVYSYCTRTVKSLAKEKSTFRV